MNLDMLQRLANGQRKRINRKVRGHNNDVYISINNNGNKYSKKVRFTVYREPGVCKFKSTCYWLPVYVADENRCYLIYSNKNEGYKQQPLKNGIGTVEITNNELVKAIEKASHGEPITKDWVMDLECGRPYIELN